MKNLILALGILFIGYSATAQNTDPSYKSKVIELMNIQSGMTDIMDDLIDNMGGAIPDDKKPAFKQEMKVVIDKILDKSADLYLEVLSKDEVDALLAFYDTPVGQGIKKKMPEMMKKSTKMGQEYSMELIMPIMQKYMK